jgi:hypothetical protein
VLQILLALAGIPDILMGFEIDEPLQPLPFRETINQAVAVLPGTTGQIVGHADIQNAVWPVGHEVNPSGGHFRRPALSTL